MLCISLYPRFLTEQAGKQRYKGHADKGNAAALIGMTLVPLLSGLFG